MERKLERLTADRAAMVIPDEELALEYFEVGRLVGYKHRHTSPPRLTRARALTVSWCMAGMTDEAADPAADG